MLTSRKAPPPPATGSFSQSEQLYFKVNWKFYSHSAIRLNLHEIQAASGRAKCEVTHVTLHITRNR